MLGDVAAVWTPPVRDGSLRHDIRIVRPRRLSSAPAPVAYTAAERTAVDRRSAAAIYIPSFYTTELGMSLAAIGWILMLARISDIVTDPVIGILSDGPERWGRGCG